jgi:hypothetical protein
LQASKLYFRKARGPRALAEGEPLSEHLALARARSTNIGGKALSLGRRRLYPWSEPQIFMHNRFSKTNNSEPQDVRQVWFAGVHSDIGGSYPEKESAISKYPLIWMIEEAVAHGLTVNRRTVNHLAWGKPRKGSPFTYVEPGFEKDPHDSMSPLWRPLEWFPKKRSLQGMGQTNIAARPLHSPRGTACDSCRCTYP